ncbi:MAG: 30S ribosomal protein S16 [Clostridia bacterium]|nr:30S ribosomal protein S16 [Clostridia bacterium]
MATKIRLKRMGSKRRPFYRLVVADSRSPRDGRFIEEIGVYDPLHGLDRTKIDEERARKWLAQGAQPTDTVRSLFVRVGILNKSKGQKNQEEA